MKTVILYASIVSVFTAVANAQNANVTWNTPLTISGDSDVNNSGTLFGSWAPYNGAAASGGLVVNGVTFDAYPTHTFPGTINNTLDNGGGNGTYNSPGTSDANYNNLLNAATFGNTGGPYTIFWNGMTAGDTYLVQLWVNDARNIGGLRTETITGGANTSANLSYGSNPDGTGPGQFVIGTFVADGTGSETLTLLANGYAPSAQFDLLQVRDITPAPEPSTLAVLAMGTGAMLFGFRRKNRAA
jgi:hypothetical protein